jgi:hypothetical protein
MHKKVKNGGFAFADQAAVRTRVTMTGVQVYPAIAFHVTPDQ